MKARPPESCAQCGADIPPRAKACPECGADERTGWREVSIYDGLDLPDEETSPASSPFHRRQPHELKWYWLAVAVFLLFAFGLWALALQ